MLPPVQAPHLLPYPRHLRLTGGVVHLPSRVLIERNRLLPVAEWRFLLKRLNDAIGTVELVFCSHRSKRCEEPLIRVGQIPSRPEESSEAYALRIHPRGICIECNHSAGLRGATATLCQLLRQYGCRLPCLRIRDWPDFPRRGVLLDISRGRVPTLDTLKELATNLAGFKINELQLYSEHTFAYRKHRKIWRKWGALTATEVRRLDAHCRGLGIDLVPNQNSFGHLRHWLAQAEFQPLAEVRVPYPSEDGTFLRYPSTLAPNHPGTLKFLRGLYNELLPNFSSRFFNVGCDETWDLGRGQSKLLCERRGHRRVYVDFLRKVQREVRRHGRTMMFWGDIILSYPEMIRELPGDVVALNWGYEASHPFERETRHFAKAGVPFYVCPGTSTWQTMIGRNDNAFSNLRAAARAGKRHGANGYLITDWGDGGHPQPLAVSYPAFLVGAALAWCRKSHRQDMLAIVLSREIFQDPTGCAARAVLSLGQAHERFRYTEPNASPFGATIAAPPPEQRELFCRTGLKLYARMPEQRIRAALAAVSKERSRLRRAEPAHCSGRRLVAELDLAARMAAESCHYQIWQKALAKRHFAKARHLANKAIRRLRGIQTDFDAYWPSRNKATSDQCARFLQWRIQDYKTQRLHFSPQEARQQPTGAASP